MTGKTLTHFWSRLEQTSSRNEMTVILAELFTQAKLDEVDKIVNLCLGRLTPLYQAVDFNLAEKMMVRALAFSFKTDETQVKKLFSQMGDIGGVAEKLAVRTDVRRNIEVNQLYQRLLEIAQQAGSGSQDRKIRLLSDLFSQLDSDTIRYVARIPLAKLRLGFSEATVIDAVSWMGQQNKSLKTELETAFNVNPDIGLLVKTFKQSGLAGVRKIKPVVGTPIKPALTERLPSPEKIIEKLEAPAVEPKYDGFRVQIHFDRRQKVDSANQLFANNDGVSYLFSRRLENTTDMFPEIAQAVKKLPVESVILDGELIGIDSKTGRFLPFQETAQRKRKYQVGSTAQKIPVKAFVFDLLYLNGQSWLAKPLWERRQQLEKLIGHQTGDLILTPQTIITTAKDLNKKFSFWLGKGMEGIVCKKTDSHYRAGKRDFTWVKYKRAMESRLADTIDCLLMGYYPGRGKRSKFGIGALLVGVWNPDKEVFETVAKIGTGLTDQQWREIKAKADQIRSTDKPESYQVPKSLVPQVWVSPEIVVEIEADEVSRSPIHTSGLALRFPRMKRFRDKKATDSTTVAELKKLYSMQKS